MGARLRALAIALALAVACLGVLVVASARPPGRVAPLTTEVASNAPLQRVELVARHDPHEVVTLVRRVGGTVELQTRERVQALIPANRMADVYSATDILEVEEPALIVPMQAAASSLGLLGVDRWHRAGFTGYGARVAILDAGFQGYEAKLGATLPTTVRTRSFRAGAPVSSGTDHGTLAAEVVHSIAPGARLYLVSFGTVTELAAAVDYLATEGIDVVSFSLGFVHNGPGDGTGPVDEIVARSTAAGALWIAAAGNWALQHWSGPYADSDGDSVHEFAPGVVQNGRQFLAGDLIAVSLRWSDPWGAACSDFDLELFGPAGTLVRASRRPQNCSGDPVEAFQVLATESGYYSARIVGASVRDARSLELLMVGSPDRGAALDIPSTLGSLSEPADSPYAIAVGALTTSGPTLAAAPFSSRGPSADGRAKPELLAPTVARAESGFAGTSAAAPHVAGLAALLHEALTSASGPELARELTLRGISLGRGQPGAPEILAHLGLVDGLGPFLPTTASQSRLIGTPPPRGGLALLVYSGPIEYPLRFAHLLVPGKRPEAYFRFDERTQSFERYIVGAPGRVQTFSAMANGGAYVVRFEDP